MDSTDLDDDLLESMRDELTDVRLSTSVEDVMARGRQLRRRRSWPVLGAGTGTVAAVLALAFSLAAPGAEPGSRHVVLDAWSVVSKPNGTVSLTIRDQRESGPERARLGKVLRAAGVAAVVRSGLPRDCHPAVTVQRGIMISRRGGIVHVTFKAGKLPKDVQVVVVIPGVVVSQGSGPSRRVEVRVPPAALRRAHELERRPRLSNPSSLPLPQVVMLGPAALCTRTTPAPGR